MSFQAHIKVCFNDVDSSGIVYYPQLAHFFNTALEDFFCTELGVDFSTLVGVRRVGLPTVHLEVEVNFRETLSSGDHLIVEVRLLNLGKTSITWGYKVYRTQDVSQVVVEGKNITVCINMDTYSKQALPSWLKPLLLNYQDKCHREENTD